MVELSADVDVSCGGVHGAARNETAFDKLVRILSHDFAVFTSAGLALVGIDDEVAGGCLLFPAGGVHEGLMVVLVSQSREALSLRFSIPISGLKGTQPLLGHEDQTL